MGIIEHTGSKSNRIMLRNLLDFAPSGLETLAHSNAPLMEPAMELYH